MKRKFPRLLPVVSPSGVFDDANVTGARNVDFEVDEDLRDARAGCHCAYSVRIDIIDRGLREPIWRQLAITGGFTLDQFADIVNRVMPWTERRDYLFEIPGATFSRPEDPVREAVRFLHDSRLVLLCDLRLHVGSEVQYTYDPCSGNAWEHRITVERAGQETFRRDFPESTGGSGACPPGAAGEPSGAFSVVAANERLAPWQAAWRQWRIVRVK